MGSSDFEADMAAIEDSSGAVGEDDFSSRGPDARTAHLERIRRL